MTYKNFCKLNVKLINNQGARQVFAYLTTPDVIHNLIIFSDMGLPAISGIGKDLEDQFANNNSDFDLSNPHNRQLVGRMVKFILGFFSYEPLAKGLDERTQLRKFSQCKYFKTASVYQQTQEPAAKKIVCSIQ